MAQRDVAHWRIVRDSVVGTSHTRAGTPCQDANGGRVVAGGLALAAVADGLGSASHSHIGAQLAVETVLDALAEELRAGPPSRNAQAEWLRSAMTGAFGAARAALERYADKQSLPLRELGTTLLAVACGPDWLMTGHIGDGTIIGLWAENRLGTVSEPERGEYANVTMPLTMDGALERVRYQYTPDPPQSVVLMSDGLQSLALNTRDNTPFKGFLLPLIETVNGIADDDKALKDLGAFLDSERINDRTDDDKTLVVINRIAAPAVNIPQPAPPISQLPMPATPTKVTTWQAPATPYHPPPDKVAPEAKPPHILEAEQLEAEARDLEETAAKLEKQAGQLFATHAGQLKHTDGIMNDAKKMREKAGRKRQEAAKLRAGKRR